MKNFAQILHYADHSNVHACWNSNPTDVENGSVNNDLCPDRLQDPRGAPSRPLRRLLPLARTLPLLAAQQYEGFTLAEIPESDGSGASLALLQSPLAERPTLAR